MHHDVYYYLYIPVIVKSNIVEPPWTLLAVTISLQGHPGTLIAA